MRIEYKEVSMTELLAYWVKDFEFTAEGESLFAYETFYDPQKGEIILKVFVNEDCESK